MKTVVFKIGPRSANGYSLELRAREAESDGNETKLLAKEEIPLESLEGALSPGNNYNAAEARRVLLQEVGASDQFKEIGAWLFRLLNRGTIAVEWKSLRESFRGMQLHTILEIEPRELRLLPWELAYDDPHTLFLESPLVRGLTNAITLSPRETWPLRVLLVVGAAPDDAGIAAELEVEGIEEALRPFGCAVHLEVLRNPSHKGIQDEVAELRPHIFHFIGHGKASVAHGQLAIWDAVAKTNWRWSVGEIIADLDPAWAPRFAFINACHSADPTEQTNAWSIAEAFLERVPAVLGMQGDVNGAAAALFAKTFYGNFASTANLDAALLAARKAVATQFPRRREWCLGCLTLSAPAESILALKPTSSIERSAIIDALNARREFVGRKILRREVWRRFEPISPLAAGRSLVLLSGDDEVGKTELARWSVASCALRGRSVVHVEFDLNASQDFMTVLRRIRDETKEAADVFRERLKPDAFKSFDHVLEYAIDGAAAPPAPLKTDSGRPWPGGDERRVRDIFKAFNQSLTLASGETDPLVLIIDRLNLAPGHEPYLLKYLFAPLARGEIPNVRMLLILRRDDYRRYSLDTLAGVDAPIPIQPFSKEEFIPLASEFVRMSGTNLDEDGRRIIVSIEKKVLGPWKPGALRKVLKFVNGDFS